jgi:hypothetical protein
MESLDRLRDDLWTRWRRQFEPQALARAMTPAGSRPVYAKSSLFDLKGFTPSSFPAGGRVHAEPIPHLDNVIYRLDDEDRPMRMETRHSVNGIDWRGAYEYGTDQAEYAEWCLQTGVCSLYARITFAAGAPQTFQRLQINGKGSFSTWRGMAPERQIATIASDPLNYQVGLEAYHVRDGRVEHADVYCEGLGAPPTISTQTYSYQAGKLDRIVHCWPTGEEQTVFASRKPVSIADLSRHLSEQIAERTIATLRSASFDAPLLALEMSYQAGESYIPALIPATVQDRLSSLSLVAELERWIALPSEAFSPEIADFEGRLRASDDYATGPRMLRAAARLVTERAPQRLETAPVFVAFAVDWEADGDQLERILKECGASPQTMAEFRSRGWL